VNPPRPAHQPSVIVVLLLCESVSGNTLSNKMDQTTQSTMEKLSPSEVVGAYVAALARCDFEHARSWLSDEKFSTRSPISTFDNADAYIESISRVGSILEGIRQRKMFVDGNDVCVILDFITHMDRRQVSPVAHFMRLESGKITYIEAFFDARAYAEMFDVD